MAEWWQIYYPTMRFRDFVFPHNPTTFKMEYDKRIVKHSYPDISGAEFEEMGMEPRTLSGSGVFFGEGAYYDFSQLSNYYYDGEPGILWHPYYGGFKVILTKITSNEEPLSNYVSYDFEFVEYNEISVYIPSSSSSSSSSNSNSSNNRYYSVVKGDNLWNISKKYYGKGSDWPKIADANKNLIKNPNLIYPGWNLLIP